MNIKCQTFYLKYYMWWWWVVVKLNLVLVELYTIYKNNNLYKIYTNYKYCMFFCNMTIRIIYFLFTRYIYKLAPHIKSFYLFLKKLK